MTPELLRTSSLIRSQSVPVQSSQSQPSPPARFLTACDAKALLSGQAPGGEASVRLSEGVEVPRGHVAVTLEDGHRAEMRPVSVEMRHVLEFEERELPAESSGQLHEGDSYIIRWTCRPQTRGGCGQAFISSSLVLQLQRVHVSVHRRDDGAS